MKRIRQKSKKKDNEVSIVSLQNSKKLKTRIRNFSLKKRTNNILNLLKKKNEAIDEKFPKEIHVQYEDGVTNPLT